MYIKEKNETTQYISLYGISSLSDFKWKVITSFNQKEKLSVLGGFIFFIKAQINRFLNSALLPKMQVGNNITKLMMNGSADLAQHVLWSKIKTTTIILDDIERVTDDNLVKIIIGEVINKVESTDNVKIICIGNHSKLLDNIKEDYEKVFINEMYFELDTSNILKILKKFAGLGEKIWPDIEDTIKNSISNYKLSNIRTLKRAVLIFKKFSECITENTNIDQSLALKSFMEDVLLICHIRFDVGLKIEDAKNQILNIQNKHLDKTKVDKSSANNDNQSKLENIFESHFINNIKQKDNINELVFECCYNECLTNETSKSFCEKMGFPRKKSNLEKFMYTFNINTLHKIDVKQFEANIKEMTDFIKKRGNDKPNLKLWFEVVDRYIYLTEKTLFPKSYFV